MEAEHECCKSKSNESIGIKNILLVGIVGAVLLLSIVQSFQIRAIKNQMTGNSISNGAIDTSGWTEDEKMQYEHHGILPARLQDQKQTSQVGSC